MHNKRVSEVVVAAMIAAAGGIVAALINIRALWVLIVVAVTLAIWVLVRRATAKGVHIHINWWVVPAVLAGIAIGFFGYSLVLDPESPSAGSSPEPTPTVGITSPADGAVVELEQVVAGTSSEIPQQMTVWVLLQDMATGRYHPQAGPASFETGGGWSLAARFGQEGDAGKAFDVVAVAADPNAHAVFVDYMATANAAQSWGGLATLPSGAQILDRVSVERR